MDVSPGPKAPVGTEALGCRTSGRLRRQPREFWRNEGRSKDTPPKRLAFEDPEAHRYRGHRQTLSVAQDKRTHASRPGSVTETSHKVMKHQADFATHTGSLPQMCDNAGAAASMPADLDVSPRNVYSCRTQKKPVVEQEQQTGASKGSRLRPRQAEKIADGAPPCKILVDDVVVAMKPLPSVRLPPRRLTRREAQPVVAAGQTASMHPSPDVKRAGTSVAPPSGTPAQYKAGYQLRNRVPAVGGAVLSTDAPEAGESVATELQPAIPRGDAGETLAAGAPVEKLRKSRTRLDPVLRTSIMVRDVAEAVRQVIGPGSASDQGKVGVRRSRMAARNAQSKEQTVAQAGSLGVQAVASDTAGTKMTVNAPAKMQPQKPDLNPAQDGAHVVTHCDKSHCATVSLVGTRPTRRSVLRDRVPPGAPLKMKPKSKLVSNPKAKGNSTQSPAAAASARQPTQQQQQQAPAPSLPAAVELEQDIEEEEASRPRKRARKASGQGTRDADAQERATAGVQRVPEASLPAPVCTQPTAATAAEEWRQQAEEGAATEELAAVQSKKKHGRKPKKASPAGDQLTSQLALQPEANIAPQKASPRQAAGLIEAFGNMPNQFQQKSVHSVVTNVGDGSMGCRTTVCAATCLEAAGQIAPQGVAPVQHQRPVNLAGDQRLQQQPQQDPMISPVATHDAVEEVLTKCGMSGMAIPAADAAPEPGIGGPYAGGRNLPATSDDAAHNVFKVPEAKPREWSPPESVVQSNVPWIWDEAKASNRQQDFPMLRVEKMNIEREPFGTTVRMLARRLYCPELRRASSEAIREDRSTHGDGEGISQQPDATQATEAADRSGGGIPQETGRTAEDRARNAAAMPSQHTRRIPPPPPFNAKPSMVANTDGGLAVHDGTQPGSGGRGLGRPLRDTDQALRMNHGALEVGWYQRNSNGIADPDTAVAMDSFPGPPPQPRQEHAHEHMHSRSYVQAAQIHPGSGAEQFSPPCHKTHGEELGKQSGLKQSWRRLNWHLPDVAHGEPGSQHRLHTVPSAAAECQEPARKPSPAPQQQQRDDIKQRSMQETVHHRRLAIDQLGADQDTGQDPAAQLHLQQAAPQQLHAFSQGIVQSLECPVPTKSQEQQRQPQQFLVPRLRANRLNQQREGELASQQQQLRQRAPVTDGRMDTYASHDLQPRSGTSAPVLAPALAPSAAESLRRAFSRAGDLQKRTRTRQPDNIDSEEDGWTPEQVRDLQMAYYNTNPTLPNFWREVAKCVQGRSAAECFNRVFGSAQDREDRGLFAKVFRRQPAPGGGSSAGRPLTLAAARKRSQKAHEQELLERIARLKRNDAENDETDDCEQGVEQDEQGDEQRAGGSRANAPSGAAGSRRRRPLLPENPNQYFAAVDDLNRTHHANRFVTSILSKQGGWAKWHKAAKETSDHRPRGAEVARSAPPAGSNPNQAGPTTRTARPRDARLTRFIERMLSKETARKQQLEWREDDRAEGLDEDEMDDEYSTEEVEEEDDKERRMLIHFLVEEGLAEPDALPTL
ncbi:hypothetical protein Vretifemale_17536 [Volvox reticuliferus]|uniref:Myb-like domain-containing protein n=1 Tax=Volvox reticuliferus TaxID=1737510 RepID=A0A8J4CU36_9CHLO|nr:hypothetical protein Vretifemale_17536 [Volvox reticuliferus]